MCWRDPPGSSLVGLAALDATVVLAVVKKQQAAPLTLDEPGNWRE